MSSLQQYKLGVTPPATTSLFTATHSEQATVQGSFVQGNWHPIQQENSHIHNFFMPVCTPAWQKVYFHRSLYQDIIDYTVFGNAFCPFVS